MHGYTKLFASIVTSTVWREPLHVKVLWVTMIAIKDKYGMVEASLPGLADLARVTREQCEDALRVLGSPDPDSRTKDLDGRRIIAVDGGWQVVNHLKYREKMGEDERRERNAAYMRSYRTRNGKRNSCELQNLPVSEVEDTDTDTDTDQRSGSGESQTRPLANARSLSPRGGPKPYPEAFEAVWKSVGEVGHLGNSIKGEAFTAWKAIGAPADAWQIQTRWAAYVASLPEYQTTPKHFGRWLKARGHEQDYESPIVDLVAKAEAKQKRADDEIRAGIEAERRKEARR